MPTASLPAGGARTAASPATGGPVAPGLAADPVSVGTAPASASLDRLASAPPSPLKIVALTQAALIAGDGARSEGQIIQVSGARRLQINGQFSGARQQLTGFFQSRVAGTQALLGIKLAELLGAAGRTLARARAAVSGALQSAQAFVGQIRLRVGRLFDGLTTSLQGTVQGITRQVTGLIDAVPWPDLPGVAPVRAAARRLLNQGAGLLNRALGRTLTFVRSALDAALGIAERLLAGFSRLVELVLSGVSTALLGAMQLATQALNRAAALLVGLLERVLTSLVLPLLSRLEGLILGLLNHAMRRALARLRSNRDEFLAALAASVHPVPGSASARAAASGSSTNPVAALLQLGRDAIQNNRTVIREFSARTGAVLAVLFGHVVAAGARVIAGITALLAGVWTALTGFAQRAVEALDRLVEAAADGLRELVRNLVEGLGGWVREAQTWVTNAASQVAQVVARALSWMRDRVGRLVRSVVAGLTGAAPAPAETTGLEAATASPALSPLPAGPITKPPPQLIELFVRIVVGGLVVATTWLLTVLFGAELAAIIMANPVLMVIVLVLLVLALLLLLLLLYLLYRLLKPRPGPPRRRVLRIVPSSLELGVGGRDVILTAHLSPGVPLFPPLTWTLNPGATAPAGVVIIGRGSRVRLRANHPPHGTVTGGRSITVRVALAANPADRSDTGPIDLIQVLTATYTAVPALANVPSLIPGTPPPNTAEPNRDGISGNTATVNTTTAPAGRPMRVAFRRSLGASVAGTTVTPGSRTGDVGLRIMDRATQAKLDETQPATAGPATLMADLTVNAVPLRVSGLTDVGRDAAGPYSTRNRITYSTSDSLHPPLTRIVGELITDGGDHFDLPAPNGGFNNAFRLNLAVPANSWTDRLVTPSGIRNVTDGRPAIDVNRFVGPGVPQLPRRVIYRQRFQYSAWQGAGTVLSRTIDDGQHIRSLIGAPGNFSFQIAHRFPGASVTAAPEAYVGNPLIIFTNVVAIPTAPGATDLAADGAATANLGVTSSVPGRTVNWSILNGDTTLIAGNPAVLPATATVQAGNRTGNFRVRAADTVFANRRADGPVRVVPVALRNMRATPATVPSGTLTTTVTLDAQPGGRTIHWSVDPAAARGGVTVAPNVTGPGAPAMGVTVTRPAGFTGAVTVTATDSVLARRSNRVVIRFR